MEDTTRELAREFLRRHALGEEVSLDTWCAENPDVADDLRRLVLEHAPDLAAAVEIEATSDYDYEETRKNAPLFDGRYRELRLLGEGGFGKVFLVEDTFHEDELLALKLIKTVHADSAEFARRFRNEIRVLRALQHEGIPPIYNDGVTADGEVYFTMAYVKGTSLHDLMAKRRLTPLEIGEFVRQIVTILDYAHEKGVVHRDLKPGNVLVEGLGTDAPRVKILDFGIAKVLKKEGNLETAMTMQTQVPIGTPHYMAPEQVKGLEVDGRTDLYSLGIMIHRMVTGQYPFEGKTAMELLAARLQNDPTPLDEDSEPLWAAAVVRGLLSREKDDRPTATQLAELIKEVAVVGREARRSHNRAVWVVAALVLLVGFLVYRSVTGEVPAVVPEDGPPVVDGGGSTPELPDDGGPDGDQEGGEPTPPEAALLTGLDVPDFVRAAELTLEGSVSNRPNGELEVGHRTVALDGEGRFRTTIELPAGATTLRFIDPVLGTELSSATVVHDTQDPIVTVDGELERVTRAQSMTLTGTARDEAPGELASLDCEGEEVTIARDGTFSHVVELGGEERSHVLRFTLKDRSGRQTVQQVTLVVDRTKPRIVFDATPPAETYESSFVLSGKVDEQNPNLLTLNGARLSLGPGNAFSSDVDLRIGTNPLTLVATDLAGLEDTKELAVVRKEAPGSEPVVRAPSGCEVASGATAGADGWADVVEHIATGITLVYVPPGRVDAHDVRWQSDEGFYIGRDEVLVGELMKLDTAPTEGDLNGEGDLPVVGVSFEDAQRFCLRAGLRLPSPGEWMHAGRGPDDVEVPWGDLGSVGCNARGIEGADTFDGLARPGELDSDVSWVGANDLAGNVSEWCDDGGESSLLGGNFNTPADRCVLAPVKGRLPRAGRADVGFRVALSLE